MEGSLGIIAHVGTIDALLPNPPNEPNEDGTTYA